ncbi:MAG TPA: hypothetical protein VFU63_14655 [Ktedonobacterales bacterium]|nr:hypothetical protein [Ktedonobacterales bacterium]
MAIAREFAPGHYTGQLGSYRILWQQPRAQMRQIVERGQQEPRAKTVLFTGERAATRGAPPDNRPSGALGPDRDDPWRGIPTPEPLVFIYSLYLL